MKISKLAIALTALFSIQAFAATNQSSDFSPELGKGNVFGSGDVVVGSNKPIYPDDVQSILDQRDLHGATQAYLWGQTLSTNWAFMDANLRVAKHLDYVTFTTTDEKRNIITTNHATPYMVSTIDLTMTGGMVVVNVPAGPTGGIMNDLQMRNITDTGLAGPDKGKGGSYLVIGPGVDAPKNHGADYVVHSKTNQLWVGTRFLTTDEKVNDRMRSESTIHPLGVESTTKIVSMGDTDYRGWGRFGMDYWRDLHQMIQKEPMGPEDAMVLAFLKRVGIEKGKPFNPTERQTKVLLEAEKLGYTQSVALSSGRQFDENLGPISTYYEGKNWGKILNLTSVNTHISEDGVMDLDSRTSYAHEAVSMSIGMTADLVGIGSKYLAAYRDSEQNWLNGSHDYKLIMPANVPAEQFWSVIGYRAETRTLLRSDNMDSSGIVSRDDIEYNDDGTVDIYYSADCSKYANCIKTTEGEDFFTYFRSYAPKKEFFDKSWQLNEVKKIK